MPKPEDTRCRAKVGTGRCKKDIVYDPELDIWSQLCAEHHAEDQTHRKTGQPRVERV